MRFHVTVFGAGTLLGRATCKRASGLNWEVTAFSCRDNFFWKDYRRKMFYMDDRRWQDNVHWNLEYKYDDHFEEFHDEIHNCAGLVYIPEPTPAVRNKQISFESNVIKMAKTVGDWSVRHFIIVEDKKLGCTISEEGERAIGEAHPTMMVSLLRPGKIFSRAHPSTCLGIYQYETLSSIGAKPARPDMTEDICAAHCITTLIHNENDSNVFRILDSNAIATYVATHHNPDDPEDYTESEEEHQVHKNEEEEGEEESNRKEHGRELEDAKSKSDKRLRKDQQQPNRENISSEQPYFYRDTIQVYHHKIIKK